MNEEPEIFLPTTLDEIFAYAAEFAQYLFAFPAAAFVDLSGQQRKILLRLREPIGQKFISAFISRIQDSIVDLSETSWRKGAPELDVRGSIVDENDTRALKSYFACPIAINDKTSAIFAFASSIRGVFTASSIQLVTALADHYSRFLSNVNATLAEVKQKAEIQVVEEKLRSERHLVEKLRKLDELKSGFMSVVSHELRTPMTAVKSSIQLILDGSAGNVTDQQRKWLDMAMRNIDRLSNLINDVLDMSRIEQGRLRLDFNIRPLRPIAEDVVASLRQGAEVVGCKLAVGKFEPSVDCYCDRDAVTQVITNLVGNAILHNPSGTHVLVSLSEYTDILATVSVTDNGKGIPPDELQRIFDKFHQVEKSLNSASEGTGLGLAISKGIIEAHGGKIWCESTLGKGTSFKFSLPRSPEAVGKIIRRARPPRESEILFGKITVLLGYADESQVEACVHLQAEQQDVRNLGDIMMERGILSDIQRDEVLTIQKANLQRPPAYDPVRTLADVILGRLAVKFNYLSQKQVNECVRIQATRQTSGQDCRLGELFVEKEYLTLSQLLDILSLQGITVMTCSRCGAQVNLFYYTPANDYWCTRCGGKLTPLTDNSAGTASSV